MKKIAKKLATFQYLKSLLGGGEKQHKRTLVIALTIIELLLIICAIISYNNKTLDKYVFGSSDLKNTNLFAIMIEDKNGEYKESTTDTFPGYEYFYNQTKSSCMDMAGKPIADSLLYNQDTKTASITVGDTSSCYLYFDNWKSGDSTAGENFAQYLINEGEMWQSGFDGDGYRYTGMNPYNYVCFGTSDTSQCVNEPSTYMYRIIGVFDDSNGKKHVKLISLLNVIKSSWHSDSTTDIAWENSNLFKSINGSGFLTNTKYDYMQDTTWLNRIENWTWSAANGELDFNYSCESSCSPKEIYLHEMNRNSKSNTIGTWTTPQAKIGLMYASDYTSILYFDSDSNVLKNFLNTHYYSSEFLKEYEWTISRYGYDGSGNYIYGIQDNGTLSILAADDFNVITRPVFYLTAEVNYISGIGAFNNPFMIGSRSASSNLLQVALSNSGSALDIKITKGTGNLNKYCINNKASINDCEWKKISGSSITYEMSKSGKYYVHVIDDAGYIAEGSIVYTFANYLKDSGKMWQSGLEGDGYRFVGTGAYNTSSTPANFVCLGTGNKNTCVNNPDKLLYRIIGVFDDQVKLIKLSSLTENLSFAPGTMFVQTSDQYRNYAASRLVSLLNSTTFLTNTDYFVSDDYRDMIDTNSKTTVTTSTYSSSGPNYYNSLTPSQIYLHENNRSSKTNTKGYWNTHNNKISVLDVSDYVLSLGDTAKSMTSGTYTNRNTLKTSWLFLGNNMYGSTSGNYTTENTTAVYGASSSSVYSTIYTWTINPSGYIYYTDKASEYATRPVFYLKKNIISRGGSGTLTDPYIIAN